MATTTTRTGIIIVTPRPNIPELAPHQTQCPGCPKAVVSMLERRVQKSLDQVLAMQRLADEFSKLWSMIDSDLEAHITLSAGTLPDLPVTGLAELLSYFTCPLTPLALALIFYEEGSDAALKRMRNMDPRLALAYARKMLNEWLKDVHLNFGITMAQSSSNNVARLLVRMIVEFLRIGFNAKDFAKASVIVATAKVVCPGTYENSVFAKFEAATLGFKLSSDFPSTMNPQVAHVMATLLMAEMKIDAMNTLLNRSIDIPKLPEIPFIPPLMQAGG